MSEPNFLNSYYLNFYAVPVAVVSTLIFAVGFFVFIQNKKSPANIFFFLFCLSLNFWLYGSSMVYCSKDPYLALQWYRWVTFFGVSHISPTVFTFSTHWLRLYEKQKKFVWFSFIAAPLFYFFAVATPYGMPRVREYFWGYYPVYGIAGRVFILFFFGYFLAAFYNFFSALTRESDPLRKKQIGLATVAYLISITGSVDYLPKLVDVSFYPFGYLSVLVWTLIVAFLIVRYRMMDIQTVVHKTIMWFATTVIAIVPFAALLYFIEDGLRSLPRAALTAALMALAAAFYFYFRLIQPRLNHLFRRRSANLQAALTQFSGELVHLKNLADMLRRFVRMLRRTVYVKQVSVYLRDETDAQFVPSLVKGVRGLKPYPASHAFLQWIENRDEVIIGDLAEGDPEAAGFKEDVTAYFSETQALVAVPFVLGGKLIGVVHLGKKENLRKYTPTEIRFLSQMKSPMTIALSNSRQFENVSRLYKQVQVQNDRLKELDRLKSEFLANTSHELRTPLHGILGLVESILDGADGDVNDAQRAHLRMIIESGTNLKELINNLLELSRIESGQEVLKVKPFNVLNVVDAIIALMEGIARKKNIRIGRTGPKTVSDVYGDPEKIQRVIMNLVGNAVKFTQKGEVIVRIGEETSQVSISAEDTGIGISPADQKLIFERFRQADGSSTRQFEGTGLGLSIAREIVRLHGSDISVESEPGKGSKFSFTLSKTPFSVQTPRQPEKEAPAETLKARLEEPVKETYGSDPAYELKKDEEFEAAIRGNGEKILIVDDNPVNREVVKTRLEMNNYRAIEAADGAEGLEKCAKEKPALVILDLMMPRMSGYDFCKELRKGHPANELPIIMLTAKTEMGDKIYGLSLGANDYISKPFNKEELIARVGILLQIRKMTHELKKWNEELEQRVDERTHELVQTQQQLIQAEKLATIGILAGGVAHEINNPLTAVLTNAQILKMGANPDDLETLSLIEEGAKRCQIIIQKLMKYARKPMGPETLGVVDVNKVVDNVTSFLDYQLRQENVRLDICKQAKELMIKGNSNELEQVLTNLILNAKDAIKQANREGLIKITTAEHNGSVDITVEDNGIGIPKENLSKVFDPFFTTKDVGKGTGLGLAVSFGIIQKHNGKIEVSSKMGAGSTFKIVLPAVTNLLQAT